MANKIEIGMDSFVGIEELADVEIEKGNSRESQSMQNFLERVELADKVGLDAVGIGEHHRAEFLDSANHMILAAAASRTKNIKLASAVSLLSAADPVRVFQNFATLDLLSQGRAEIVAGRGSFTEAFGLFGYDLSDYHELFSEKLDLLLNLRDEEVVNWRGNFRAELKEKKVYPKPLQKKLPVWVGVGGTPASFERAGRLGLPLMVAIIGGETRRFAPLVEIYRKAWKDAGYPEGEELVGLHELGYVAKTSEQAREEFYPGYKRNFDQISKERGGFPVNREVYEYQCAKNGAFLIGDPKEVAEKINRHSEVLGGVSRVNIHMDIARLKHDQLKQAIELLGKEVKSLMNKL